MVMLEQVVDSATIWSTALKIAISLNSFTLKHIYRWNVDSTVTSLQYLQLLQIQLDMCKNHFKN